MADITMCATEECPLADTCYRKLAKESEYQSWAIFEFKEIGFCVSCKSYVYRRPGIEVTT